MKIAVLSDLHFGPKNMFVASRLGEFGETLLMRAVRRLNELVRPDMTFFAGDLLNNGRSRGATERMLKLKGILNKLDSPWIVIPGNHDCAKGKFFEIFPEPSDVVDVGNTRILTFVDKDEPGYNAIRRERDIQRFAAARQGFNGRIIALQHVPVFPGGMSECPYNYTNAPDILEAMRLSGVSLSVSGHYHSGFDLPEHDGIRYVCAPAVCEAPFRFLVVNIDNKISVENHQLALPEPNKFRDMHIHTQFAYCSEDMGFRETVRLAQVFGLSGIGFSEHSDHLNYKRQDCWGGRCKEDGIDGALPEDNRFEDYIRKTRFSRKNGVKIGLEVECDFHGRPVITANQAAKLDYMIGAVHGLKTLARRERDLARVDDEFIGTHEKFLRNGFPVLAHPFRIFRRANLKANPELFKPLVRILRENGTAAEINFHTNAPPHEFFRLCIDSGVKITFGSDAHNLSEIGDFARHLRFLEEIGYNGDITDIIKKF